MAAETSQDPGRHSSRGFVLLLALAFTVVIGVAIATYLSYQRASAELIVERDRQVVYLSAARLKDEIGRFSDALYTVARLTEVAQGSEEQRRSALHSSESQLNLFDGGVVLLDSFGKVVAVEPGREGILNQDWSAKAFFRELLITPDVYISDALREGLGGEEVVVISVPLVGGSQEFNGALVGMFRVGEPTISAFYASIVRLRLGQGGTTYVLDGSNRVLYDSNAAAPTPFPVTLNLSYIPKDSPGGALRTSDEAGNDIVAAYARVPGTHWILVTEDDWSLVARATRRYEITLLVLLVLGILLPVLAVIFLVRWQRGRVLQQEFIERDINMAKRFQEILLPQQRPLLPGWDIAVYYQKAQVMGGDFHDFILLPDGNLAVIICNMNDQGVPAAFAMTTLRSSLRSATRFDHSPAGILECCNAVISPELHPGKFISCLYALIDTSSGEVTYAVAGFNPPYLQKESGGSLPETTTHPLGETLDAHYSDQHIHLGRQDRLILYSNGLLQLQNPQGEAFGFERLKALLEKPFPESQVFIQEVITEVKQFTGGKIPKKENVTIIALGCELEIETEPLVELGTRWKGA